MDVLQSLGVPAVDSSRFAVPVSRDQGRTQRMLDATQEKRSLVAAITGAPPTFVEVYGGGSIVDASNGLRRNLNVKRLHALDLRTLKPNGQRWDSNCQIDSQKARALIEETQPLWLIGSPPCTAFPTWQGINFKEMSPRAVHEKLEEGRRHLRFVTSLYRYQLSQGRHFLHGHPFGAARWRDPWMESLLSTPKVITAVSDQCEYGFKTRDRDGNIVHAMKPTKWATTSAAMAQRLSKRWTKTHVHQHLDGGRAKKAALYPIELITKILRGIGDTADLEDAQRDVEHPDLLHAVRVQERLRDLSPDPALGAKQAIRPPAGRRTDVRVMDGSSRTVCLGEHFKQGYKDEYTQEVLPRRHLQDAILDELDHSNKHVWRVVSMSEALKNKQAKKTGSRWALCSNNGALDPDVRARLVAQENHLYNDESF